LKLMAKREKDESRFSILLVLFLFRGPFGLAMLWRSRQFSHGEKILLTCVLAAYTLVLVAVFYAAAMHIFKSMTL